MIYWQAYFDLRESGTYADQMKYVYHWDVESEWYKVLQRQGHRKNTRTRKTYKRERDLPIMALWVSPNADANESWARWMVSATDYRSQSVYLHTIAMPRRLYAYYTQMEQPEGNKEFVINEEHWDQLIPVSVKRYNRSDLLKMSFAQARRRELHRRLPYGSEGNPYDRLSKNSQEYLRTKQREKEIEDNL